jgi:hypothetical protein
MAGLYLSIKEGAKRVLYTNRKSKERENRGGKK